MIGHRRGAVKGAMEFIASAAFGLEGLVKRDLQRLGVQGIKPLEQGGVAFEGDLAQAFAANLWLRTADRVLLVMARQPVRSFEALFQCVRAVAWEDILPKDAQVPVCAQCARSQLMSPSDCQSIAKKALAERMKAAYGYQRMPETGAVHQVEVMLHGDIATIALNTSGPALSRRGYRTWNGEAPLRETLAAALALCCPWRPQMPLYDPCCGTGTLLIEAAYIALDRAPGLTRSFHMEDWPGAPRQAMADCRRQAQERYRAGWERPLAVAGSDIDPQALELARRHLNQAGLTGRVRLECLDLRQVRLPEEAGALLTNPPYGQRLGDLRAARAVARQLGLLQERTPGWSLSAITADPGFERALGRRGDKRRRFYNGRLECELITYYPTDQRGKST